MISISKSILSVDEILSNAFAVIPGLTERGGREYSW